MFTITRLYDIKLSILNKQCDKIVTKKQCINFNKTYIISNNSVYLGTIIITKKHMQCSRIYLTSIYVNIIHKRRS